MLGIMLAEMVALLDETLRRGLDLLSGRPLALLMWLFLALFLLQGLGVICVLAGRYRVGGVLQMVASGCHVPDLFGLVGVAGGWKAYHYPARAAASASKRADAEGVAQRPSERASG